MLGLTRLIISGFLVALEQDNRTHLELQLLKTSRLCTALGYGECLNKVALLRPNKVTLLEVQSHQSEPEVSGRVAHV